MGFNLGQVETEYGVGDQSWLGSSHGVDTAESITLDASEFSAVTWPDRIIKSGTVVGKITASGLFAPYTDAGAGGLDTARYHLLTDVDVSKGDSVGAGFWHGQVIEAKLPANHGLTAAAKADLKLIHYV